MEPHWSFALIIFHNLSGFLRVITFLFGPISSVDAAWGINSLIVLEYHFTVKCEYLVHLEQISPSL